VIVKVGRTNIDTGTRLVMDYERKETGRTYVQPGAPMGTVVADILKLADVVVEEAQAACRERTSSERVALL
jgi:hypothetical protein